MVEEPVRPTWEYQVVEEGNPTHLQERLDEEARNGGWEAISLGYAGECRLLALLRRPASTSDSAAREDADVALVR